jgi:hypothetical protein
MREGELVHSPERAANQSAYGIAEAMRWYENTISSKGVRAPSAGMYPQRERTLGDTPSAGTGGIYGELLPWVSRNKR